MEKPVQKNKEYIVDIIDNGFEGEGIAKIDNFTIFIPGAVKGEKIKMSKELEALEILKSLINNHGKFAFDRIWW